MRKIDFKVRGFSLIEIMVVVIILGLMLGVVVPALISKIRDGEVARIKSDFSNIKTALRTYEMDNYSMPTTEQGLDALASKTDIAPLPRKWPKRGYLERLPKDPWERPYIYILDGDDFQLYSLGRDGQEGGAGPDKDFFYRDIF
ncbi:type II secretion system major pseudopilin GspG [Marinagarivorans cellulosilyticus]|uniref:Type II secretion system core protein G n=1 Tax=Marinagarivorans cellulosilyticus TaxID=2721545 RepID=A0AAN2BMA7_9GAMM|nr:type II secretion system major pseudopilin GspG [Marinagarivorans cellulosilyticus]BCD99886.1 general secretion pathway protein G [Marinagarivorans cellulosilyticus]